jgi:hypothetical protein
MSVNISSGIDYDNYGNYKIKKDYVKYTDTIDNFVPLLLSYYSNVIFDLYKDKITIHEFKQKAMSASKFGNRYLLTLKAGSIFYHCLYDENYIYVTSYLYTNMSNNFFLEMKLSDPTEGILRTESNGIPLDMVCLPSRNKLETIIHLQVYFCKMVGIKNIKFTDVALKVKKEESYKLLSYRIFATDKDISDLSIYSKFFRMPYILDSKLKHTCIDFSEFLQRIRTTKFNELIIETSDSDKELLKNLKDKIGEKSLLEYFKNFDKEDDEKIKDLNDIVTLISNSTNLGETYRKLLTCVIHFTVPVDDYYNPKLILPQFKSIKKSKKKTKKSKKKPKKSKSKKSKKKSTKV